MPKDTIDPQDGLAEQLHLYRDRLVRLCGYLSGIREAAEDLAQETLAETWRLRHRFYDDEGLLFWLSAIARNICSPWRRERAGAGTGAECPLPREHEHPGAAYDIELELEHGALSHLLDCALTRIPADTRQVLIPQFIEGASQAEIADELGLSVGAVKLRVHRGKQVNWPVATGRKSRVRSMRRWPSRSSANRKSTERAAGSSIGAAIPAGTCIR